MPAVLLYVLALASFGLALPKSESNNLQETNYAGVTNATDKKADQQAESVTVELSQVPEDGRKIPIYSDFHCPAGKAGAECRKAKRKQRLIQANLGLSDRIDAYETRKRTCQFGEYYDNGKNTCEKCDTRCYEGDLTTCGLECRVYFQVKRLREQMELGDEKLRNENKSHLTRTNICIGVTVVSIFVAFVSILKTCIIRRKMKGFKKKVHEIERRNYGIQACDEEDDEDTNGGESSQVISGKKIGWKKMFCCGKSKAVRV